MTTEEIAGLSVDELAQIIRAVDGSNSLGAGALAEAIITSLPPARVEEGPRVKALVWDSIESTSMWAEQKWASDPAFWWCYRITLRTDGMHMLRLEGLGNTNTSIGQFFTWDDAKAAAQADYDRRILSALSPTPEAPGTGLGSGETEWIGDFLNRRTDVEKVLRDVKRGKRQALSPEECWELANRLSVPANHGGA